VNLTSIGKSSDSVKIDTTGYKAVIDSGTSVIIGPKSLMGPLLKDISVSADCSDMDKLPNISFVFDGIEYELEPNDYVLQVKAFGITECLLSLMPADMPEGFNYLILGDVFMRRYYTFFDKNTDRLGFYDVHKLNSIA
jgi:cathepsin D